MTTLDKKCTWKIKHLLILYNYINNINNYIKFIFYTINYVIYISDWLYKVCIL